MSGEFMKNVFFKPWVGSKYGKRDSIFRQKILVLGDSHYIDETDDVAATVNEEPCDFTTDVMLDYLDPNEKGRWKSTFTKFMNSFVLDSYSLVSSDHALSFHLLVGNSNIYYTVIVYLCVSITLHLL